MCTAQIFDPCSQVQVWQLKLSKAVFICKTHFIMAGECLCRLNVTPTCTECISKCCWATLVTHIVLITFIKYKTFSYKGYSIRSISQTFQVGDPARWLWLSLNTAPINHDYKWHIIASVSPGSEFKPKLKDVVCLLRIIWSAYSILVLLFQLNLQPCPIFILTITSIQ